MGKREGTESQEMNVTEEVNSIDKNDDIVEIESMDSIVEMFDEKEIERMMRKRKSFHRRVIAVLMILLMIATYSVFRGSWW